MVGYFFTAKKLAERRWVSRNLLCVSILAASTSASTQELAGFCSSIWRWPRSLLKCPRVVVTDMTRIANDICEWVGSISQIIIILLEKRFLRKSFSLLCLSGGWKAHSKTNGTVACKQKEGRGVRFVTTAKSVTNLTPRPSFFASVNLVRMAITVLSPVKSDKNVRYPLILSGDRQKVEILFHEDVSPAQTHRRRLARGDAATCRG